MYVGIFWIIPGLQGIAIIGFKERATVAATYGDCLTSEMSHIDAWQQTQRGRPVLGPLDDATKKVVRNAEYEDWPRGRVVYDQAVGKFVVYTDRQAICHKGMILKFFQLPLDAVFRTDLHYSRSKRLPKA